jgi:hypothetical protein
VSLGCEVLLQKGDDLGDVLPWSVNDVGGKGLEQNHYRQVKQHGGICFSLDLIQQGLAVIENQLSEK